MVVIEDWGLLDAFYMTVITLTTVGLGEVQPLSPMGKLFTSMLIMAGVGIATYSLSVMVRTVVEGELRRLRGGIKMRKKIESFSNHIIVCGYGRLGRIVLRELADAGVDTVIIEQDEKLAEEFERDQAPHVVGSAYEDDTLIAAGIEKAKALVTLLPKDAENVYVTLCARDLNPSIHIIARSDEENGEGRLRRAGANQVFSPYRVSGTRIVQRIIRPNVSDFLELAASTSGQRLAIEEVVVAPESILVGKTIEDSELRNRTGAVIAAFIDPQGQMVFNPGAKSVIEPGTTLIVLGEKDSLERLSAML